jgi:hypothetical protein
MEVEMTTNEKETVKSAELNYSEAPSSWNTRNISPDSFECQITLPGENGSELLERANNAIAYVLKNGCKPYTFYRGGNHQKAQVQKDSNNRNGKEAQQSDKSWCPIHECEMRRWEKEVDQYLYFVLETKENILIETLHPSESEMIECG